MCTTNGAAHITGGEKGCDTPIILTNSKKKSVPNEPFVSPDRPVQTLRKIIVSVRFIFWTVSKKL
jgi:hypothetical protein